MALNLYADICSLLAATIQNSVAIIGYKMHLTGCHDQGRNYHLFVGGGVFGEFALPNFIIPCEVIGVRLKKFFEGGRHSSVRQGA